MKNYCKNYLETERVYKKSSQHIWDFWHLDTKTEKQLNQHTLCKDDNCIAKKSMEWIRVSVCGLSRGRPLKRGAEQLKKSWYKPKLIAKNHTRWIVSVDASLCPPRD